jgi:hypothetical protein
MIGSRWQFSLRCLLALVTLICIAGGYYSHVRGSYSRQWIALAYIVGTNQETAWDKRGLSINNQPNLLHQQSGWRFTFPAENASKVADVDSSTSVSCTTQPSDSLVLQSLYADVDLQQITSLSVGGIDGVSRFLDKLECFPFLKDLALSSPSLTDEDIDRLGRLPALRKLSISSKCVTGVGFANLRVLTDVALDSPSFSRQGLSDICALPTLTSLTLRTGANNNALSDLSPLSSAESLFSIELHGNIDDNSLQVLGTLPSLDMAFVRPAKPDRVTDAGIRAITKSQSLHYLSIEGNITDAAIEPIIGCMSLKLLDVSNCRMSEEGRARLRNARPDITLNFYDQAIDSP